MAVDGKEAVFERFNFGLDERDPLIYEGSLLGGGAEETRVGCEGSDYMRGWTGMNQPIDHGARDIVELNYVPYLAIAADSKRVKPSVPSKPGAFPLGNLARYSGVLFVSPSFTWDRVSSTPAMAAAIRA